MNYYADLAAALRARKCTEEQTLDVLRTVRETVMASGTTPTQEFGSAKAYAENFSGTRRFTVVQLAHGASLIVSIVVLVALRLTAFRGVEFFPWGVIQGVVVFVVIGVAGEVMARWAGRRVPRSFHESVAS